MSQSPVHWVQLWIEFTTNNNSRKLSYLSLSDCIRMDIANFTTYRKVEDEDPDQVKRKKQREKKAVNKFSLLYMFPGSLLNEKGTGNKRKGFVTYDSLVCKKCSPVRFFHARSALKLHAIEAHDRTESRGFANYSIPAVSRITHTRKAKQRQRHRFCF